MVSWSLLDNLGLDKSCLLLQENDELTYEEIQAFE